MEFLASLVIKAFVGTSVCGTVSVAAVYGYDKTLLGFAKDNSQHSTENLGQGGGDKVATMPAGDEKQKSKVDTSNDALSQEKKDTTDTLKNIASNDDTNQQAKIKDELEVTGSSETSEGVKDPKQKDNDDIKKADVNNLNVDTAEAEVSVGVEMTDVKATDSEQKSSVEILPAIDQSDQNNQIDNLETNQEQTSEIDTTADQDTTTDKVSPQPEP